MTLVRRPLVGITLCYMLGLLLGRAAPTDRGLLIALGTGVLSAALGLHWVAAAWRTGVRSILLLTVVLLVGWARIGVTEHPSIESILATSPMGQAEVSVTGRVAADPSSEKGAGGSGYRFPLNVERIQVEGQADRAARGTVRVRWYGSLKYGAGPAYGERWHISGPLRTGRHGRPDGILRLVSSNRKSVRLSCGPMARVVHLCLAFRHQAAETLRVGIEDYPDTVGLVQALLLGYRSELSTEAYRLFVRTGTLHIFAISGLHVGIVVALILFALAACSVPRSRWLLFVAPLLIGYTLMTGMKPSAIRACIMAIVFLGASALHRRADSYSSVSFAALLLLACCPEIITDASFVLSFAVVSGILLIFPHVESLLHPVWAPDKWQIEKEPLAVRLVWTCGRRVATVVAVSVSAWLVSAPLVAYSFGRVAPVALLANVIVVPMAFLIVLAGAISILLGTLFGFAADIFNHAALTLTHIMLGGLRLLSGIPGGFLEVPGTPFWALPLWYGTLVALLLYRCAVLQQKAPVWVEE